MVAESLTPLLPASSGAYRLIALSITGSQGSIWAPTGVKTVQEGVVGEMLRAGLIVLEERVAEETRCGPVNL